MVWFVSDSRDLKTAIGKTRYQMPNVNNVLEHTTEKKKFKQARYFPQQKTGHTLVASRCYIRIKRNIAFVRKYLEKLLVHTVHYVDFMSHL